MRGAAPETIASRLVALRQSLGETGYIDGQNVAVEYRQQGSLLRAAADLVARHAG